MIEIDDRDVETDLDDFWLLSVGSVAVDPFPWPSWSIPVASIDRPGLGRVDGRSLIRIPLRI